MLTAVKATYENGQIIWQEKPTVKDGTAVIVTFLDEKSSTVRKPRKAGSLAGRGMLPPDFNEPLDDLNDYM